MRPSQSWSSCDDGALSDKGFVVKLLHTRSAVQQLQDKEFGTGGQPDPYHLSCLVFLLGHARGRANSSSQPPEPAASL